MGRRVRDSSNLADSALTSVAFPREKSDSLVMGVDDDARHKIFLYRYSLKQVSVLVADGRSTGLNVHRKSGIVRCSRC